MNSLKKYWHKLEKKYACQTTHWSGDLIYIHAHEHIYINTYMLTYMGAYILEIQMPTTCMHVVIHTYMYR